MFGSALIVAVMAAVAAYSAAARAADAPSTLLEKAIYTEETVGDLDAAAKLYQQAVEEANKTEAVAAKAQYRLGLCLLKQGKKQEGIAALEKVVQQFPEQKQLVAAARKHLPAAAGLKLLPPMWGEGESLHYAIQLGGGLEIGTVVYAVESATLDGKKIWRFRARTTAASRQVASRVDADFDTLMPINSYWTIAGAGEKICRYQGEKVSLKSVAAGKETTQTLDVSPAPYDNEEGMFVFRCLPMGENYRAQVPIFTSFGGVAISIGFEVQGKETVKVPAGKFKCFKVLLPTPVNQTFWFSDDEHHYPVKINANGVVMPLVKVERLTPGKTRKYSDAAISFSLPFGWYVYQKRTGLYENEPGLTLLTPDVDWDIRIATITLEKLGKLSAEAKESPRAGAERGLLDLAKQLKDLKVRADSWQSTAVSGQPAASYVADFVSADGRPMALYVVCVFGKTTAASVTANCPRDDLDRMKKALRPVVESFEVK
jgi:tetratricopeptide (TPR) repeat protein